MVNFTCMSHIFYNNLKTQKKNKKERKKNWHFALHLSHFTFFWVCVFIYILLHLKKIQMPSTEIRWKTQKSMGVESGGKTMKLSTQTSSRTSQRWPGHRAPCFRGQTKQRCKWSLEQFPGTNTHERLGFSQNRGLRERPLASTQKKDHMYTVQCAFRTHSTAPTINTSAGLLLLLPLVLSEKKGVALQRGGHPTGRPPSQSSDWL